MKSFKLQEPFPPPIWSSPKVLWRPDDGESGIRLVQITVPHDLVEWGKYMGHSGGRYQHWALDTGVWTFLTFLDRDDWPHVTIHLKDRMWFGRPHPDDTSAMEEWPWGFGPGPTRLDGRAAAWLDSQAYESISFRYRRPIWFDGRQQVVMAAGHRDGDPLWEGERKLVDRWYQTVAMDDPPVEFERMRR